MPIYATMQTFLHTAGDYIKFNLFTDLTKSGKKLVFADVECTDFEIYDVQDNLVYFLSSGNVYNDGQLVTNDGEVVYDDCDYFEYDVTNSLVMVNVRQNETKEFEPGVHGIKLRLVFTNGEVLSFMYREALHVLCPYM